VESSFITAIGYNAETQVLEVEFKAGRIYQYLDVPPETYAELMASESIGRGFALISSAFAFQRADEPEQDPPAAA
jgi:hypothetical protein